jgi:methylmalonyl-CoA mutase, C-terminal domain
MPPGPGRPALYLTIALFYNLCRSLPAERRGDLARRLRVLVAESGEPRRRMEAAALGASLRDAGMEVIYTGWGKTAAQIVQAAVQEDADVIGLNLSSEGFSDTALEVVRLLREEGIADKAVVVRADVSESSKALLLRGGVVAVFGTTAAAAEIVDFIFEEEASH